MDLVGIPLNDLQSIGTPILGAVSIALSVVALAISWRTAHTDLVNLNSWETYRTYNGKDVRRGRVLALRILRDTGGRGLPTRADYREYFKLDTPEQTADEPTRKRQQERQYLHDLAAFYHQTGVLLRQHRLDRDFTLLLVGPGLADRWALLEPLASYYEQREQEDGDFPYGGMYLLYQAYARWKGRRFAGLRRLFVRARSWAREAR